MKLHPVFDENGERQFLSRDELIGLVLAGNIADTDLSSERVAEAVGVKTWRVKELRRYHVLRGPIARSSLDDVRRMLSGPLPNAVRRGRRHLARAYRRRKLRRVLGGI